MLYYHLLFFILFISKTYSYKLLHKEVRFSVALQDSFKFIPYLFLQQILLWLLWQFISHYVESSILQMVIVSTSFTAFHLYAFLRFKISDAMMLMISSFVGGIIFIYSYQIFMYGFYVAFLVHVTYHTILDLLYLFLRRGPIMRR